MTIQKKSQDLKKRMRTVLMGGGREAIERQVLLGKMTARERI